MFELSPWFGQDCPSGRHSPSLTDMKYGVNPAVTDLSVTRPSAENYLRDLVQYNRVPKLRCLQNHTVPSFGGFFRALYKKVSAVEFFLGARNGCACVCGSACLWPAGAGSTLPARRRPARPGRRGSRGPRGPPRHHRRSPAPAVLRGRDASATPRRGHRCGHRGQGEREFSAPVGGGNVFHYL